MGFLAFFLVRDPSLVTAGKISSGDSFECLGADLGCLPTLCFRNMGFPFDCQKSDATLPSLNPFQSPLPICSSLMDEKKINMLGRFSCPNSSSGNPDLSKLPPL